MSQDQSSHPEPEQTPPQSTQAEQPPVRQPSEPPQVEQPLSVDAFLHQASHSLTSAAQSLTSAAQSLQRTWEQSLPILKTQSNKILQRVVQTIDRVVARFNERSAQTTNAAKPDPRSPRGKANADVENAWNTPTTSSQAPEMFSLPFASEVAERIAALIIKLRPYFEDLQARGRSLIEKMPLEKIPPLLEKIRPALEKIRPVLDTALEKLQPIVARIQEWWHSTLPKIRSRLPVALNEQLSDRALTGVAVGLSVLLLWIGTGVLSGNPKTAQRSPIASSPSTPLPASAPVQNTPALAAPAIAPDASRPLPDVAEAPPNLNLTPQQGLIAAIQEQVAEVTDRYANGLIQATQANFRGSILMVKLSPDWYALSPGQQDNLVNDMLKRSKELDFRRLEILDADNTLLARSPVVGDRMVVMHRETL
jgi:hypothetical protein